MKTTSKISTLIIAIAVTGMLVFGAATTNHAQSLRAWEANTHSTRLVSISCNGGVCEAVFEGSGTVNIMGPVTVTTHVVQDFNITPCNPAVVDATFVGATGTVTYSYSCASVCQTHPATIAGVWTLTGGTGQFSGIVGGGSDQGTIAGNGPNVHSSGVVVF
jgi:hypothetical protein